MSAQATTEGTATPEAAAPERTIDSELDQMFGDRAPAAPEPASETPSEGTTPAAADSSAETSEGAEPTATAVDSETPPSEGSTPDAAATVEDDPFKDTKAAEYVINGKAIPVEDIRVFAEGGAVIRPESLPNILSKLAERDTLSERFRTRDSEYQTLAKVTEWKDDASGKSYAGPEAVVELRVRAAELFAENQLVVSEVLECEDLHAAGFLTTKRIPDATVEGGFREAVVFRPDAIQRLQEKNELRNLKTSTAVRDHYKGLLAAQKVEAPVDYTTAGPALIEQVAKAANLDASVLTPQDKSILVKHLPFHTRNNLASLEWQELVKDRIQERVAQKASTSKVVDATTKAVKEGQARMAAAARGVKPNVARATPQKPVVQTPQAKRHENEAEAFDAMLLSGAGAMRSAER